MIIWPAAAPLRSIIKGASQATRGAAATNPSASRDSRLAAMSSSSTNSYSIWAQPKGELASVLQSEISHLASSHSAPSFVPHVTVVAGAEGTERDILTRAADLATHLKPYNLHFDTVSSGQAFFQCVYILCDQDDDSSQKAAATARRLMGKNENDPYMPHLSLLYSDMPVSDRKALAEALQARLMSGSSTCASPLPAKSFTVDSLSVWLTPAGDQTLQSWKLIKQLPLPAK